MQVDEHKQQQQRSDDDGKNSTTHNRNNTTLLPQRGIQSDHSHAVVAGCTGEKSDYSKMCVCLSF